MLLPTLRSSQRPRPSEPGAPHVRPRLHAQDFTGPHGLKQAVAARCGVPNGKWTLMAWKCSRGSGHRVTAVCDSSVAVRFPSLRPEGRCSLRVAQVRFAPKHAVEQTRWPAHAKTRRKGVCGRTVTPSAGGTWRHWLSCPQLRAKMAVIFLGGFQQYVQSLKIRETLTVPAASGWRLSDPRTIKSAWRSRTNLCSDTCMKAPEGLRTVRA